MDPESSTIKIVYIIYIILHLYNIDRQYRDIRYIDNMHVTHIYC